MSSSSTPRGNPHRLKRILWTIVAVIVGGGGYVSCHFGGEQDPKDPPAVISQNCIPVFSPHSCTPPSPSPAPEKRKDAPEQRKATPQLVLHQQAPTRALVRRTGRAIVRGTPSIDGPIRYELDPHTTVNIICQRWADLVQAPDAKPTALWDEIGPGEWVTDAAIDTNSDSPVTKLC